MSTELLTVTKKIQQAYRELADYYRKNGLEEQAHKYNILALEYHDINMLLLGAVPAEEILEQKKRLVRELSNGKIDVI